MTSTLNLLGNGAVGFIDWLGCCFKSSRTRWRLHFKGADVNTTIHNAVDTRRFAPGDGDWCHQVQPLLEGAFLKSTCAEWNAAAASRRVPLTIARAFDDFARHYEVAYGGAPDA